ncbi:MAG: hypothetical protein AAF597_19040 [Bacteroidota bacterium]
MRHLIILFALSWTLSLSAQDSPCLQQVPFGDVSICLPKVPGMTECYADPFIKAIADATEAPTNEVLGYYLDSMEYVNFDTLNPQGLKNYFKVYGVTQVSRMPTGTEELDMLYGIMVQQLGDTTNFWRNIGNDVNARLGEGLEVGVPKMIERYQLTDDSFTMVALMEIQEPDTTTTIVLSISGILLSERFVCMAYYNPYVDPGSVALLKERSDGVVRRLLGAGE